MQNHAQPIPTNRVIERSLQQLKRLNQRQKKLAGLIERRTKRLEQLQNARLASGAVFFASLTLLAIRTGTHLEWPVLLLFTGLFAWLIRATRRFEKHLHGLHGLQTFFARQEARLNGAPPENLDWQAAAETANRLALRLPRDVGTFGPVSLWNLIDETLTDGGREKLLSWLADVQPSVGVIEARQKLVQSLRPEAWFYTRLAAHASRFAVEDDSPAALRQSTAQILEALAKPFTEASFPAALSVSLTLWLAALVLVPASLYWHWGIGGYAVLAFAAINFGCLHYAGDAFLKGVGLSHHLSELAPIFSSLEARLPYSARLSALMPRTRAEGPSRQVKKLERALGFLGVKTNPLLHLIVNVFAPWTLLSTLLVERARKAIEAAFPVCLRELAELEALGSLVILERYQSDVYPRFAPEDGGENFQLRGVFHPLLERKKAVSNDFAFPKGKSLGLLTGSNMSGKSTFLRTLGVNQLLANLGAPVFCEEFSTRVRRVETCIEVTDSLRDGFSYFYAEVRKLKSILSDVDRGEPVLFLVDEIFRGTNNRERQIGSRAVIRSLAKATRASGFVSTHDLELVALEESSPRLMNLHFRETFDTSGKMLFTYQLHAGPCPTTNALKIMRDEGIVLD